eukprot:c20416_g2_i1.p1 GENE.c20416_g2_i1~~c20416_g2_i1.p1  ORF type:complete len:519 (-),score=188.67 c20416_g2_i1:51-1607(-)
MASLILEKKKIDKWKKYNRLFRMPTYAEVEQKAPMKEGWLKRQVGLASEWKDYYFFIKGHFLYFFLERKKRSRAVGCVLILKSKITITEETAAFGTVYPFNLYLALHISPHWSTKKYLKSYNKLQDEIDDYRFKNNITSTEIEYEDEADKLGESKQSVGRLAGHPFFSKLVLASTSDRVRKEWITLIKFLSSIQHVGTSKMEELAKRTIIPGVSAQALEMGNMLMKKKREKWKKIHETKPMLLEIKQPLDLEGNIKMITGRTAMWNTRYFVLKGHFLYYFEQSMPSCRMQGLVFLRNATIEHVVKDTDLILEIKSVFPCKWPTSDNDKSIFHLSFDSKLQMDKWWDTLRAHAALVHAGRSKQKAKREKIKEIEYARLYGTAKAETITGSWLVKAPESATDKLAEIYSVGWRDREKESEIKSERKRLSKLKKADIAVEVTKKSKELQKKAREEAKKHSSLAPAVDPFSIAQAGEGEDDAEEVLAEVKQKERRSYADWKQVKTKTSMTIADYQKEVAASK